MAANCEESGVGKQRCHTVFLWIPWFLRSSSDAASLNRKRYFTFVKCFDTFTRVVKVKNLRSTSWWGQSGSKRRSR